ncbi:MAG: hypothetical protein IJU61_06790, partial [Victivallales bacterium]|nr:hypothetical protein [Victivallales bacterium]
MRTPETGWLSISRFGGSLVPPPGLKAFGRIRIGSSGCDTGCCGTGCCGGSATDGAGGGGGCGADGCDVVAAIGAGGGAGYVPCVVPVIFDGSV